MKTSLEASSSLAMGVKLPPVIADGAVLVMVRLIPEQVSSEVVWKGAMAVGAICAVLRYKNGGREEGSYVSLIRKRLSLARK